MKPPSILKPKSVTLMNDTIYGLSAMIKCEEESYIIYRSHGLRNINKSSYSSIELNDEDKAEDILNHDEIVDMHQKYLLDRYSMNDLLSVNRSICNDMIDIKLNSIRHIYLEQGIEKIEDPSEFIGMVMDWSYLASIDKLYMTRIPIESPVCYNLEEYNKFNDPLSLFRSTILNCDISIKFLGENEYGMAKSDHIDFYFSHSIVKDYALIRPFVNSNDSYNKDNNIPIWHKVD